MRKYFLSRPAPALTGTHSTRLRCRLPDQLHEDYCITELTLVSLGDVYDTQKLLELPMLVGHYHMSP
jgi:hypothetical protein